MREIKFRAWDKKTKKIRDVESIAFGILCPSNNGYPICNMKGYSIIENKDYLIHRDSQDFILLQYTGLKDKNGKEIYEGDICLFSDWSKVYPIEWRDGRFYLGNTLVICCKMECESMEIIGNIYENKELLDGTDGK